MAAWTIPSDVRMDNDTPDSPFSVRGVEEEEGQTPSRQYSPLSQAKDMAPPPEDAIPDWLASMMWWPITFFGFLLRLVSRKDLSPF